jgi:ribonuclease Z
MRRIFLAAISVALLAAVGWRLAGEAIVVRAFEQRVVVNLSGQRLADMQGGLNLVLCGSGSPLPDPERAGPCMMVQAGEQLLVIDVGSGSPRNLGLMGIPAGAIDAVLLTHFHSDHIDGLGELILQRWAGSQHTAPLPVLGPPGVDSVVAGFNQAYTLDVGYRIAHHGAEVMPAVAAGAQAQPFALPDAQGAIVYAADGLVVRAFPVPHDPVENAVGYRIDYAGRSLVISGDTAASAVLQQHSQGVDILAHEALSPDLVQVIRRGAEQADNPRVVAIMDDILDYHTTTQEAAQIAAQAGVGRLVFYHTIPQLPVKPLERRFLRGVDQFYAGPVDLGADGDWWHLPANSSAVQQRNLLQLF